MRAGPAAERGEKGHQSFGSERYQGLPLHGVGIAKIGEHITDAVGRDLVATSRGEFCISCHERMANSLR